MRSIEPVQDSDRGKHEKRRGEYKTITSRRKKYPLQFSVILVGSVIIVGIILLIFFFGSTNFIVFIGILLIPVYMGIYWIFRVLRKDRKYVRISLMAEFERAKSISVKEEILVQKIKPILEEMGAINLQLTSTNPPKITCNFSSGNEYDFFEVVNFLADSSTEFKMEAIIKGNYPFSVSIRQLSKAKTNVSSIQDIFSFHSNSEKLITSILSNKEIDKNLMDLGKDLISFSLNGKFLSASVNSKTAVYAILELSSHIYNDVLIQDYGELKVEKLYCYQCEDAFDISELKCNHCGAPRPTCIVCLLDLKLAEKKKVVRTPCCETYGHRDHLISWLEKNPTCPNCKNDLFLWIRNLKQEV